MNLPWPVVAKEITSLNYQEILIDLFNFNQGRICNFEIILLWFPDVLHYYTQLVTTIMSQEAPLL
jgi:hypothetical protein